MAVFGLISVPVVLILFYALIKPDQVTSVILEDNIEGTNWTKCSLNFSSEKEHYRFNKYIENNRLIMLSINLIWMDISDKSSRNNSHIVEPTWYLATEEAGKALLLLEDQFIVMSLGTLSFSVDKISLTLKQIPENCLAQQSEVQAMKILSLFLLESSKDQYTHKKSAIYDEFYKDYICNGTLGLKGSCCSLDEDGILLCGRLEENEWTNTVDIIVLIFAFIVFCQIIRLLPKQFYMEKKKNSEKIQLHHRIALNIEMKKTPSYRHSVVVKGIKSFKNGKRLIKSYNDSNIKTIIINTLHLHADEKRFVSMESTTTKFHYIIQDLIQMFKDLFCRCSHEDLEGMKECCCYDFCFKFLSVLEKLFYLLLITLPLFVRLVFLRVYDMEQFRVHFTILLANILYLCCLKLLHVIKIKRLKLSKRPLRKCMKKVMTINFRSEFNNAVQSIHAMFIKSDRLISHTKKSKKSLLISWLQITLLVIPFTVTACLFKIMIFALPLLHFIVRVSISLTTVCVNKMGYGVKVSRFLYITVFLFGIVLTSCSFLVVYLYIDLTTFLIECLLYMTLGLFQNFDEFYVYLSLIILILTFVVQCFRKVNFKLSHFNKKVVIILETLQKSINRINGTILIKRDGLFYKTKQFLYYYKEGENDQQKYLYVSKAFLNHLSSVPSPLTPGPRNWLYFKAFIEIVVMFVLLCLLVVIVITYGNATDLSTGMKFLVTLGGGALLTWFNRYLSNAFSHSLLENDELLKNVIQKYIPHGFEEIWEVIDFGGLSVDETARNYDLCRVYRNYALIYCVYVEQKRKQIQFFTPEAFDESFKSSKDQESESISSLLCEVITVTCTCSKPNRYKELINETQHSNVEYNSVRLSNLKTNEYKISTENTTVKQILM